jgi:hypothetical protein
MDQLSIRHALEEKVREIGGKVTDAGCMMVPPFTMDFVFEMDGKRYSVDLVNLENLEEARKARENPPDEDCSVAETYAEVDEAEVEKH